MDLNSVVRPESVVKVMMGDRRRRPPGSRTMRTIVPSARPSASRQNSTLLSFERARRSTMPPMGRVEPSQPKRNSFQFTARAAYPRASRKIVDRSRRLGVNVTALRRVAS